MTISQKIDKLRLLMNENHIDSYLIDNADYHSSEYVNDFFKERSFMSGFDGSNGYLLVTLTEALLWTDGRYFLQAEKDLKDTPIKLMKMDTEDPTLFEYLKSNNLKELGLDGKKFSFSFVSSLKSILNVSTNLSLIDLIWEEKDTLNFKDIYKLSDDLTGETFESKVKRVRDEIEKNKCDSLLITSLDDIAWLYNLRGRDVECNPVFFAFTFITLDNAFLFIDKDQFDNDTLYDYAVKSNFILKDYNEFTDFLYELEGLNISICYTNTNFEYINIVSKKNKVFNFKSPTTLFKACKNEKEIENNIDIHKADGLAVFRFMKYAKESYKLKLDKLDEYKLAKKVEEFRSYDARYYEPSFETIAAWKENGAIIHYEPSINNFSEITEDSFLLLDSGGQYDGGTTDITRTISLGKVSKKMKHHYTLVLKSHIDLAMAKFLKGTSGSNLDMIARKPIWNEHLNYKHGTGHGIGFMLNVHEGPQSISYQAKGNQVLMPGMIISNEPGLYFENKYGIRIENEILVREDKKNDFGEFYKFETITYCPYDLSCINKKELTKEEKNWLNKYHKTCRKVLSSLIEDKEEIKYLKKITRKI